MPSWSNLRKHVRAKMAGPLRDRMDFHYTLYEGHWVRHKRTVRGKLTDEGDMIVREERRPDTTGREAKHCSFWITVDGEEVLRLGCCGPSLVKEWSGPDYAIAALKQYLNLSIANALNSSDIIIRGMAMLDSRLGVRRVLKVEPGPDEHPFIRSCYGLRTSGKWSEIPYASSVSPS
jgi:hypothetical protein